MIRSTYMPPKERCSSIDDVVVVCSMPPEWSWKRRREKTRRYDWWLVSHTLLSAPVESSTVGACGTSKGGKVAVICSTAVFRDAVAVSPRQLGLGKSQLTPRFFAATDDASLIGAGFEATDRSTYTYHPHLCGACHLCVVGWVGDAAPCVRFLVPIAAGEKGCVSFSPSPAATGA